MQKKFLKLNGKFMAEEVKNNGMPAKKGLKELLEFLKSKKIITLVASSSPTKQVIRNLNKAGIPLKYFNYIIGGEKVKHPKPDPEIYIKAKSVLRINVEEIIALEDSDFGVQSAYSAGIKPVLIPDLKKPNENTLKMTYKKFDSLDQVVQLFLQ